MTDWSESYLRAQAALVVAEEALKLGAKRKAEHALTTAIDALEQVRAAITEREAA